MTGLIQQLKAALQADAARRNQERAAARRAYTWALLYDDPEAMSAGSMIDLMGILGKVAKALDGDARAVREFAANPEPRERDIMVLRGLDPEAVLPIEGDTCDG